MVEVHTLAILLAVPGLPPEDRGQGEDTGETWTKRDTVQLWRTGRRHWPIMEDQVRIVANNGGQGELLGHSWMRVRRY